MVGLLESKIGKWEEELYFLPKGGSIVSPLF
jgi:hypothetical protein